MKSSFIALALAATAFLAVSANASTERRAKPSGTAPVVLRQQAPVYLPLVPGMAVAGNKMSGWTSLTNGATGGGAALAEGPYHKIIVVRGADDNLYAAFFNPLAPRKIESSEWRQLISGARSEPVCASPTTSLIGCTYLGDNGKIVYTTLADAQASLARTGMGDLGGQGAGAAPTITAGPGKSASIPFYMDVAVWNGQGNLLARRYATQFALMGMTEAPVGTNGNSSWTTLPTPVFGPVGCAEKRCAMVTGNKQILILTISNPNQKPTIEVPAPKLDGGASGRPALVKLASGKYAVVVRSDADGTLRHITYDGQKEAFDGGWVSEGGFVMSGSSPACLATNEQATCVIQGQDGRIYAKALSTASGL